MNADEALNQIEQLLRNRSLPNLPYPQNAIFKGAWEGKTYEAIAQQPRKLYDTSYIKGLGSALCKSLTTILEVKIRKPTFQEDVLQGLARQAQKPAQLTQWSTGSTPTSTLGIAPISWAENKELVESLITRLLSEERAISLVGISDFDQIASLDRLHRLVYQGDVQTQFFLQTIVLLNQSTTNFETLAKVLLEASQYFSIQAEIGKLEAVLLVSAPASNSCGNPS
jgi:hypothetical protein